MSEISKLTSLLSRLPEVQHTKDGQVFTGAQNKDVVDEAVGQARSALATRDLTMVESYYFAWALEHQANLESDQDTKRDLKIEAFSWRKKVFFDSEIPDTLPAVRRRTVDELERPRVADELLEALVGPDPPLDDPAFADHLAAYLWTVGDGYWPSMFRYAMTVGDRGDFATSAGLQCDLIRRSANMESLEGDPMPATVMWAAITLKKLAKETKRLGDSELAADYGSAAKEIDTDDGWCRGLKIPGVVALTEAAVRNIAG